MTEIEPDRAKQKGRDLPAGHYILTGSSESDGGEVTLLGLWDIFWSQRFLIIGIGFFFAISSIGIALLLTPIYRADSVLAPVDAGEMPDVASRLSGIASLAGIQLGNSTGGQNAIAILRSREFAANFIVERNLLPVFFEDKWDADSGEWIAADPDDIPQVFDAVEYFHENIFSVKEDPMSGLVTIAIEWKDPDLAADWVNSLVEQVNRETRLRALREAEKNLSYLQTQMESAVVMEVRSAISRIIESELNTIMIANAREQYAFRVIDPAMAPTKKTRPRRALIVITSTILGGFLALFIALTRHTIRRQKDIRDRSDS